jgi:glycosyltransferase involved in cell wall biosynthesis
MGGNFQYAISMLQALASVMSGKKLVVFYDHNSLLDEHDAKVPGAKYIKVNNETPNLLRTWVRLLIGLTGLKMGFTCFRGRYSVLDQYGCDVIFHPYWGPGAFITNTPAIAAIHDCAPREAPSAMRWRARTALDLLIRSIVRHARFILADSQHGRWLIIKHYKAHPDQVIVLPFRPPNYLISPSENRKESVLRKYRIRQGYLFLPGRWGSYKNTERVLLALKILSENGIHSQELVLCGLKEHDLFLARNEIARLNLQNRVHVLGFVPDEDMASLYQGALALVFPTLLGPTSIPVYEAMALECPVIVSNISGYPEQVGDAAVLVDPFSVQSIADAILRVITDSQLRDNLKAKGKQKLKSVCSINHGEILFKLAEKVVR